MNRRRFLAALATGGTAAIAGCGYAHGGGDVRETRSFGGRSTTGGFARAVEHAVGDDRIVRAVTGETPFSFGEPTEIGVFDRAGDPVWEVAHDAVTAALATDRAAETVFLVEDLEEGADLLAFDGPETLGETDRGDDEGTGSLPEGSLAWRTSVDGLVERVEEDGRTPPMAGDGRETYLALSDEVIAVRDGTVAWRRSFDVDDRIYAIHAGFDAETAGPAAVVVADHAVVALAADGDVRWRHAAVPSEGESSSSDDGPPAVEVPPIDAVPAPRVHVRDGDRVLALDPADGTRQWEVTVVDGEDPTHAVEGIVAVAGRDAGGAVDAANGEVLWTTDRRTASPLVADAERGYSVTGDAVRAVDADGIAWRRELDDAGGVVIDGWVEPGRVAFAFDDGRIVTLQRYDEEPGVLPSV